MRLQMLLIFLMGLIALATMAQTPNLLPVPPQPSQEQRIKQLESKVTALEDRVRQLEEESKFRIKPLTESR